jgi:hypothetical protein
MTTPRWTLYLLAATLILAFPALATAQPPEHPEHPEEDEAAAPALTEAELADAIEAHVTAVAEENDGVYPLQDPETGETLNLELVKVHEERLARTAPDTYFACVDFAGPDGTTYDVDFFMTGAAAEELAFEEFSIHKVDGVERYTWHEEDGVWTQKPVGGEGGEHEHPEEEHPEEQEHPEEPPPPAG